MRKHSLTIIFITVFSGGVVLLPDHPNSFGKESPYGPFHKQPSAAYKSEAESVPYEIVGRVEGPNGFLSLLIVVSPQYFTREEMKRLAHQLNQDFPDPQRLFAQIMDDEKVAKNVNPAGASYSLFQELKRGEYYLDRKKGKEYIAFSTKRGRAANEVRITLSRARKSRGR